MACLLSYLYENWNSQDTTCLDDGAGAGADAGAPGVGGVVAADAIGHQEANHLPSGARRELPNN